MNLDQVFEVFEQAREACGHQEYVVIGSLSILGFEEAGTPPADMTMSNDIDGYTRLDPGRILDLGPLLGEDSPFHVAHGFFLDPVSPSLPALPDGWEQRLHRVARNGLVLWFLDPADAAISKYARGEPRDLRWIAAGLRAGLISLDDVQARMATTPFLDDEEAQRVRQLVRAHVDAFGGKPD